jgi:hypothetical protein
VARTFSKNSISITTMSTKTSSNALLRRGRAGSQIPLSYELTYEPLRPIA